MDLFYLDLAAGHLETARLAHQNGNMRHCLKCARDAAHCIRLATRGQEEEIKDEPARTPTSASGTNGGAVPG